MKAIFRMLRPMFKKLLIAQMKSKQNLIVDILMKKIDLKMSGEMEEKTLNDLYDSLEAIIVSQIEAI